MNTSDTSAWQGLLDEISSGLAEATEAMTSRAGAMEEISATLAELLEVIKTARSKSELDGMVAALKSIRVTAPDVHVTHEVTVQPASIQIIERAPARAFRVSGILYDRGGRLESLEVFPIID